MRRTSMSRSCATCVLIRELLEPGGYLVGDDYVAVWPDVIRVAHEFAQSVNQPLTVAEPKWILQKPQ